MPHVETACVSLYYEDTGSAALPVLLLHELGGTSESWREVMALLAPTHRVLAMDYRCAGRSEKPAAPFALEALADDAAAVIAHAGMGPVVVAGAALGSLVGVLLAGRHPALVRSLALFAISDEMSGRTAAYMTERAARVRAEGMRPVMDASLANAFPEPFAAARTRYRSIYLANNPAGYASLSLALAGARLEQAVWDAVLVPTLVVSGARDFIWPPELGRRAAGRIAGARFAVLDEAGHFPHLQTPADVAAMVAARAGVL